MNYKYESNYKLDKLNTLRLQSTTAGFVVLDNVEQLPSISTLIKQYKNKFFVLGGGSNIILPEFYSGLVIYNKLLGIELLNNVNNTNSNVNRVKVMAGEPWDYFVAYSLEHNLYGLENLSLIPGTVGASPIQNIGAYGVEVKDFIDYVEAYDTVTQKMVVLHNSECQFKYRDSMFKHTDGGRYIITAVVFKLLRTPSLVVNYGDVKQHMEALGRVTWSVHDLRECIIKIRQSKLPDPKMIGNVGSFFHNPILNNDDIKILQQDFPNMPIHAVNDTCSKISAGWLIDNLGLKGYREGNLGIYAKQALVIVNYVGTDTDERTAVTQNILLNFAHMVQKKVLERYNIVLNIEPIIIE